MIGLELACLAIVGTYVVVKLSREDEPERFAARLFLLIIAAWLGENSVIHTYGFYEYSPRWSLFIDQVPLFIVLIWPVVILSAYDLATYLGDVRLAFLIVLADASLIEPIAVQSGLWWWSQPGFFAIPPIGVLGWAFFAGLCVVVFERLRPVWVLVLPPLLVHGALLCAWWGGLRWVNAPIGDPAAVAVAWACSLLALFFVVRGRVRERVPLFEMLLRVPAAGFFFVLLGLFAADRSMLIIYAVAFAPPYLAMVNLSPPRLQRW